MRIYRFEHICFDFIQALDRLLGLLLRLGETLVYTVEIFIDVSQVSLDLL